MFVRRLFTSYRRSIPTLQKRYCTNTERVKLLPLNVLKEEEKFITSIKELQGDKVEVKTLPNGLIITYVPMKIRKQIKQQQEPSMIQEAAMKVFQSLLFALSVPVVIFLAFGLLYFLVYLADGYDPIWSFMAFVFWLAFIISLVA